LELKDKITTEEAIGIGMDTIVPTHNLESDAQGEAVEALVALGYSNQDAVNCILALPDRSGPVEVLIKNGLKYLMKP